jgi:phospholipid-binding lipoprotein MlaA
VSYIIRCCIMLVTVALCGCASAPRNPQDPLEGFNRTMFSFNDKVDQVALKPAARVYKAVLPTFVQTGIGNFFGNIGDVSTALNNLLQARITDGMSDIARVMVNSVIGLGGIIDVASPGLPKHDQDFGQTLGRWGVQSGPYLVLPLIGPTTVRDAAAMPVDLETDLWSYKYPVRWRNTGSVIRVIDHRAYILDSSTLIEDAALDKYEFVRDAYMQRRRSKIYTGDTPQDSGGADDDKPSSSDGAGADNKPN